MSAGGFALFHRASALLIVLFYAGCLAAFFYPFIAGWKGVRREVEKYTGKLEIGTEKNEFCVTVLLQERRGNE